jgi:hypothetical protein
MEYALWTLAILLGIYVLIRFARRSDGLLDPTDHPD